jgi:hypothetical protein
VETGYGVTCQVFEIQGRPRIALLDGDYLETHISASSKDSIEGALESEEMQGPSLVTEKE